MTLAALILLPAALLLAQQQPIPQATDRVQVLQTVTNGFVHPGIAFTKETLENARKQILAKKDPWHSGFQRLAADPKSARTVNCRNESGTRPGMPDIDAFDSRNMDARLKQDAYKAKQQALMYFFTGDNAYRANALKIVRVWSHMDPKKYRNYPEAHIHASYPIQDLIIAAELLRSTSTDDPKLAWTGQDTKDFTENFVAPAVNTFLNENGWFMNQNGYPLAAAMSGDIFRSDRESYAKRVEWFTVNKTAPNKGWSSSITHLARLVDTNAITGQKASTPVVQLVEMGRDQAHAGDDVDIFMNTARQMNAQGTKVDPVSGEISTAENAVGPYEFLNDRILAAANAFCQFMLGYDTPWIPTPSDIGPNGELRCIYPRIADNYRGRIRGLDCWDAYYYYAFGKGENVAAKAPFYHEAFTKRIVNSLTDWIFIPESATGEAARVAPTTQEPPLIEIEQRSTAFDKNAAVMREGGTAFLRVTPAATGTRIAILSADTDKKTIGLRIRTNGPAEVEMSGLERPWLLPDTGGKWLTLIYPVGRLERFRDIVYFTIKAAPGTRIDLDTLLRDAAATVQAPAFKQPGNVNLITYVGATVKLDFAASGKNPPVIESSDKPRDSVLNPSTGAFLWIPAREGAVEFVVTAIEGDAAAAKKARVFAARDRDAAVQKITASYDGKIPCVRKSLEACQTAFQRVKALGPKTPNDVFSARLSELQAAFDALEPLTPRLPDGTMDFPKIVASSDINESIALLADSNDDTFPVYSLAKDMNYVFDFGPRFRFSASAFALEGRLNFENRTQDTVFFGSDDGKKWTALTKPLETLPTEMTKIGVKPDLADKQFRYLKIEKTSKDSSNLFEPSGLRIYGDRHEVD